jgi:hypothetical protein
MLNMWGQMNVEMVSLVKAYWNETHGSVPHFYPKSKFGWSLWIGQRKLSS